MRNMAIMYLLLALFLFVRYIRANKNIIVLIASLVFCGLAIYNLKDFILWMFLLIGFALLAIYIAFLKEKKDTRILKIQAGYKPLETIFHYIIFGVITFIIMIIILR